MWQRCNGASYTKGVETYYIDGDGLTTTSTVSTPVLRCDGAHNYDWYLPGRPFYQKNSTVCYSVRCDGSRVESGCNCLSGYSALAKADCHVCTYYNKSINCRSYDTLLAEFIPVDQCTSALGYTSTSCAQNCKDPVDKATAATPAVETCGDGIDNDCDGQVDEGGVLHQVFQATALSINAWALRQILTAAISIILRHCFRYKTRGFP